MPITQIPFQDPVAPPEKTERLLVCLDADVVIAGLMSRTGASHAIRVLGEIGLLRTVLPEAAVAEVRRNVDAKLPEALPLFEEFLPSGGIRICRPTTRSGTSARLRRPEGRSDLCAALGAGASLLVTHNARHLRSGEGVRVVRPRTLIEEVRAWMSSFGS